MPIGCFSHRSRCPCRLLIYWSLVWGKEFEFLGNFDGRDFVDDVQTSKLVAKMDGKDGHVAVLSCHWLSLQVKKLRDYLVDKYENLEAAMVPNEPQILLSDRFMSLSLISCNFHHPMSKDAYDAFEQKMPPSDMGGTDLKDIPEKRRKRREGGGPFSQKNTTNTSIFIDSVSINHQTSVDNRQCAVTIMIIIIMIIITTINLYVYV